MAGTTKFPSSWDAFGDVADYTDDVLDDHVNDLRRAIEALEKKLGLTWQSYQWFPTDRDPGDLGYDQGAKVLRVWDGASWKAM